MKKKEQCALCKYVGTVKEHVKIEGKLSDAADMWASRGELKDWNALVKAAELYANRKKRSKK